MRVVSLSSLSPGVSGFYAPPMTRRQRAKAERESRERRARELAHYEDVKRRALSGDEDALDEWVELNRWT